MIGSSRQEGIDSDFAVVRQKQLVFVNKGHNNGSTNERPYKGKRTPGMIIPLPIKNN
jgi:hypothetical protein